MKTEETKKKKKRLIISYYLGNLGRKCNLSISFDAQKAVAARGALLRLWCIPAVWSDGPGPYGGEAQALYREKAAGEEATSGMAASTARQKWCLS